MIKIRLINEKNLNIFVFLYPFSVFSMEELAGKQFLCSKLLWGFEFTTDEKVNVFYTDINNKTYVKEYYYEKDSKLPYVNLYILEKNIRDVAYSIHRETFRVDIWTMTSGGNTTREIIPSGFCELVSVKNLYLYIENLKDNQSSN